jgi:hypothetical protein
MARTTKTERRIVAMLEELAAEAKVEISFGYKSKHPFYTVRVGGQTRTKTFGLNAGSSHEGQLQAIRREFARIIREIGQNG